MIARINGLPLRDTGTAKPIHVSRNGYRAGKNAPFISYSKLNRALPDHAIAYLQARTDFSATKKRSKGGEEMIQVSDSVPLLAPYNMALEAERVGEKEKRDRER